MSTTDGLRPCPTARQRTRSSLAGLCSLCVAMVLAGCGAGGGTDSGATLTNARVKALTEPPAASAAILTPNEQLGKNIFFDQSLSLNGNQSCASCHVPETGWTGPDSSINALGAVYAGSVSTLFGNRKPPSSAYATASPVFHYVLDKKGAALFVGGNFWDGRATGEKLGNPAADQAQGPFLNPVEQALSTPADVMNRICSSAYAHLFTEVWGSDACDMSTAARIEAGFDRAALSIAAYEGSPESNAYTSKFDYYLKGMVKLSQQERLGLNMFKGKGKCAGCHVLDSGRNGEPPLLTDFTFDNLGLPRNPDNPFYVNTVFNPQGFAWIDMGLGQFLGSRPEFQAFAEENLGKHKVPTLRNVDKRPYAGFVKAYGHNGYFKSLKGFVHFYNTRDVKPRCPDPFTREADALAMNCWPAPEVENEVNTREMGNLHLTDAQEDAIVAFLRTLSDGYQP